MKKTLRTRLLISMLAAFYLLTVAAYEVAAGSAPHDRNALYLDAPIMYMGSPHYESCGTEVILEFEQIDPMPGRTVQVFRSTSPDSGYALIESDASSPFYDYDLTPRTIYYYKLRNAFDGEVSGFSEVRSFNVESNYYDPGLTLTLFQHGVEVKVTDNTYAEERYEMVRYDADTHENYVVLNSNLLRPDSGSTYTIYDDSVLPNTRYTYAVGTKVKRYCEKYGWPWNEIVVEKTILSGPGPNCLGTGKIRRDLWENVPGLTLADIPGDEGITHTHEITSFETPNYSGNNYAARIYGYLCVPQTGYYTFWIASDDQSALFLSPFESPEDKQQIAYVSRAVRFRQYGVFASQRSDSIYLTKGRKYYIEALHKEGNGGDHVSVAWKLPDGTLEAPIAGSHLIPFGYTGNLPPTVQVTNPVDNQEETWATTVDITAEASDPDGTIWKLEFYINGNKVSEHETIPYLYQWTNVPEGLHQIVAKAYDNNGLAVTDTVNYLVRYAGCEGSGHVNWEVWKNIPGMEISSVPFETAPTEMIELPDFETGQFYANYYGSRVNGYLCVPVTGYYTFYISADDKAELWLSMEGPDTKVLIASVNKATAYRQYNKYASQTSAPIFLEKTRGYYMEARHKEANGNDHLSVGMQFPDGTMERPIKGIRINEYYNVYPDADVSAARFGTGPVQPSFEENTISVYPNPVSDRRISILHSPGIQAASTRVQIISVNGVVIHDKVVDCTEGCAQIDVDLGEKVTAGMYAVMLQTGKRRDVIKLLVK